MRDDPAESDLHAILYADIRRGRTGIPRAPAPAFRLRTVEFDTVPDAFGKKIPTMFGPLQEAPRESDEFCLAARSKSFEELLRTPLRSF